MTFLRNTTVASLALLISISACKKKDEQSQEGEKESIEAVSRGLDVTNLDTLVDPCSDFYMFANGGWLKNNPIPGAESSWGAFNELNEKNNAILKKILEEASSAKSNPGSAEQKVGDFYYAGMDTANIEKNGITPLKTELDRIAKISDTETLVEVLARHKMLQISSLFNIYVDQDTKNSTVYALFAHQGGLTLPDKDYYLSNDEKLKNIRQEYLGYIQKVFSLLGDPENVAKQKAETVLALETRLAKASMSRVEMRDPYATYNKKTVAELQKLSPNLNWNTLLAKLGISNPEYVIVGQPAFFKEVDKMFKGVPVADWKTYLTWQLMHSTAPFVNKEFVTAYFNFNGKVLSGAKEMQPRWKRVLRTTDKLMGEALGQLYVKEAFSPEAKAKALSMVHNLRAAFKQHIKALDWMSPETKEKAINKLDAIAIKIGYPDEWKTYKGLEIKRDSYVQNVLRAREFDFNYDMQKLGKPVNRSEWFMSPPTVNAYYNPTLNEIVFPAGILQPPFFDPKADDAVNYGGMGAVIGHELTHGFDDEGRQFDQQGNLKDWWSPVDAKQFEKKAHVVVKQFDNYKVFEDLNVNGQLTLGENLADLGGLNIAYTALQMALQGKEKKKIDGFTPEQRFFLSWAQVWRNNTRDEYMRQRVMTDPHSPEHFRTNGPLTNLPQFEKAFGCKPNYNMVKPDSLRAKIW